MRCGRMSRVVSPRTKRSRVVRFGARCRTRLQIYWRGIGCILADSDSLRYSGRHRDRHSGDAQQVAGGHGELELLIDTVQSAKHRLSNAAHRLAPAKVFLDPFANGLAHLVTGMASGTSVYRTAAAAVCLQDSPAHRNRSQLSADQRGHIVGIVNPMANDRAEYRVAQHLPRDKYVDPDLSVEATPIRRGSQDQSSLTPLIVAPLIP
jgi:hypothetical protein